MWEELASHYQSLALQTMTTLKGLSGQEDHSFILEIVDTSQVTQGLDISAAFISNGTRKYYSNLSVNIMLAWHDCQSNCAMQTDGRVLFFLFNVCVVP